MNKKYHSNINCPAKWQPLDRGYDAFTTRPRAGQRCSAITIETLSDYWQWTRQILVPKLYPDAWYNDDALTWREKQFVQGLTYFRVGSPRLRQARVEIGECKLPKRVNQPHSCYPFYGISTYLHEDYSVSWSARNTNETSADDPWRYQTSAESESYPMWGQLDLYGGGGYVKVLGSNAEEAKTSLGYLEENGWIDRATRAVINELTVFNPSTNLFSVMSLVLEMPPSGGVIPSYGIRTMRLYFYSGNRALFRFLLEAFVLAFVVYFSYVSAKELIKTGRKYFADAWNFLEVGNVTLAFACCVVNVVHYLATRSTLDEFKNDTRGFTGFQKLVYWDDLLNALLGALVFFVMMKLLKILRCSKKVTEFVSTLSLSKKSIGGFLAMFGLIFFSFVHFFYLTCGRHLKNYSSLSQTSGTLIAMMMKRFHYGELVEVDRVLGPVFFFLYVLFVAFIITQILVAVLNLDYSAVKKGTLTSDQHELVDFLVDQFRKTFNLDRSDEVLAYKEDRG